MKNGFMRIFTLLSMLLLSGAAFADTSISSSAVTNHTDLSISYLAQIFGTVGNSLQGTSGQMLGMLFYKFNQGILVVAGFWLSYLVFTTFIKSAHEGSFISPNRNIVIILLRVALGFGLLLPNPVTGYSVFQDILMKVVVSGVSLADETWSYGLRYLNNGGEVWRDPTTASGGNTVLSLSQVQKIVGENTAGPNNPNLGPAQKIFLNEVCMYSSAGLSASVIQGRNAFSFPDGSNSKGSGCGSLVVPGSGTSQGFAQQGASAMVYDLLPAAKAFVCQLNPTMDGCSGNNTSDVPADIANGFFNAALGYANAVMPATTTQSPDQASRAFIQQAETGGWMLAGRYYWDLARVTSNYNQSVDITSSNYLPAVTLTPLMPQSCAGGSCSVTQQQLSSGLNAVGAYTNATLQLVSQYSNASSAGSGTRANGFSDSDTMSNMPGAVATLLWPYEDGLNGIENNFALVGGKDPSHSYQSATGYSYDPIVFLHNIGMRCLSLAGAIWITTSVVILAMSAATIFCQSVVNANSILQALVSWMKPFLMMMAVVFLGVGLTLGYYVPLYPYLLFTFGVIGWLIRVLVGMAAAPLVCLGMTHPEGHDFLGIAQQLFQLLLSIFIEPTLMIIGLFAGMILSYVSLRILVYTFSGFISDLFGTAASGASHTLLTSAVMAGNNFANQNLGGPTLVYLTLPILLIIFASIVYTVTNKCFSVIHELPGAVMQWIGAPGIQSAAGQMADSVAGVVSQAGQNMGRGLSADAAMGTLKNKDGTQFFLKDHIQKKKESSIPVDPPA